MKTRENDVDLRVKVTGAPGTLHSSLVGIVEWARGKSVRVRWEGGGTLTGPAHAFVRAR